MKILQTPVSDNHKSAMFFNGVIATSGDYELRTFQDGEIALLDDEENICYIGEAIRQLGKKGRINDQDIEEEQNVDIYVDKFICIYYKGTLIDEGRYYFDDYDEAIQEFEEFLANV
jgi:hypothetical protein